MNIPKVMSTISFGSGYPLGPGGRWNNVSFKGASTPYRKNPEDFTYSYPGMIPDVEGRNPFGGVLHRINYFA